MTCPPLQRRLPPALPWLRTWKHCAQLSAALALVRCSIDGFGGGIAAAVLHWLEKPVLPPQKTATGDVA